MVLAVDEQKSAESTLQVGMLVYCWSSTDGWLFLVMLLWSLEAYCNLIQMSWYCGGCSGRGEKVNMGDQRDSRVESDDAYKDDRVVEDAHHTMIPQMERVQDVEDQTLETPR